MQESLYRVWEMEKDMERFSLFPLSEAPNSGNSRQKLRNYIPISSKTLKDLQQASAQYGSIASFT